MLSTSVIIPLYQYPHTPTTWAPLYNAIDKHPNLHFVVIVNPNSGPGCPPAPDAHYAHEIPRLNTWANVQTVGMNETQGVYVQGIFFDETPNHWSAEAADYLDMITTEVRKDTGIKGKRLVMHNPGTVPDASLANQKPDITAVFEDNYSRYRSQSTQGVISAKSYDRAGSLFIVHSTPIGDIKRLVNDLRPQAEYLFVTDLQERYYESFGPGWTTFIEAITADPVVAGKAAHKKAAARKPSRSRSSSNPT
ncbi:hypothetical protein QFC21_006915 [Naganishia friedmannii]|uniref:Uncharacterized protein n=1 Tax=Naganishia friedmannii TaxID=89922 RepID=A0ACC2UYX3_9TREE|nr:hypothetical protein QFC21_006915 [Naganishia friedmannii]